MPIPFDIINAAALRQGESLARSWCPGGSVKGQEYLPRNPTRDDKTAGSFSINIQTGIWSEFASGDSGNDLISLYAYIHKVGQGDAARALANICGIKIVDTPPSPDTKRAGAPPARRPDAHWSYHNEGGKIAFQVWRWDLPDGKKDVRPAIPNPHAPPAFLHRWSPAPRPLYGVHLLLAPENAGKIVLMVEGEKAVEGARRALGADSKVFVTTWSGGSGQLKNTDYTPLRGRKVVLLPDNDAPGRKAMVRVGRLLEQESVAGVFIIAPQDMSKRPAKWDLGDWDVGVDGSLMAWLRTALADRRYSPDHYDNRLAGRQAPERARVLDVDDDELPLRALGMRRTTPSDVTYYFQSHRTGVVLELKATQITEAYLLQLADPEYWRGLATNPNGTISWRTIQATLMEICHQRGHIDINAARRGRGVWLASNGAIVVHSGNKMFDGQQWISPTRQKDYIMERSPSINLGAVESASTEDFDSVYEAMDMMRWVSPWMPKFLLGWTLAAPFSGLLDWRPHCVVAGPAGSGKTTVTRDLVWKKCLGDLVTNVVGGTTEAGIRRLIGIDALPVRFDENEIHGRSERAGQGVKDMLHFARVSSSESGGKIQHGDGNQYSPRAMFMFSWINATMHEEADQTRFVSLELMRNSGKDRNKAKEKFFEAVHSISPDYWRKSFWWVYNNIDKWVEARKVFRDVYEKAHKSNRKADTLAPIYSLSLLALSGGKIPSYAAAAAWVNSEADAAAIEEIDSAPDDMALLDYILNFVHKFQDIEGHHTELMIKDLIEKVYVARPHNSHESGVLRRFGIKVRMRGDESTHSVAFAVSGHQLNAALWRTRWRDGWQHMLARVPGAKKAQKPMAFADRKTSARYIELPIALCLDDDDD